MSNFPMTEQAYQQIFRTQTGKEIFNQMYTDER